MIHSKETRNANIAMAESRRNQKAYINGHARVEILCSPKKFIY